MNKRKGIIYLTIGVVTLLVLVAGAAYAYFQVQSDDGKSAILNATTGTTDNLTFSVSDIDVSKDKQDYVIDEETTENIIINASQDNFGENDKTIGDGVTGKATLLANSTNSTATMNYNVYFAINENNFKYTTEEKKPELILKVYDPEGKEITKIEGLNYHEKDETNNKDISGFDITERKGAFAIKHGQTIETTSGKKEEKWKVEVYLINLASDQLKNAGKTLTGVVKITTTEEDTYTLAHINTIKSETTSSSIKATVELDENSTNEVTKYYFAIEKKGIAQTVGLSEKTKSEIEDWKEETVDYHLFEGLDDNTNYIIYSYVVDSEGFESSLYETEIIPTDVILPQITNVEVTDITTESISIEVTSEPGSLEIKEYEYSITKANEEDSSTIEISKETTHTFDKLQDNTEYIITVRAKDIKGNYSTLYTPANVTTEELPYHLKCNDDSGACKIAKLSINDNTIIYHDGQPDYDEMENANLEAGDLSYRYTGENPDNYICFGVDNCDETTNYENLYRIIGVFKNKETNNYEIKLIKANIATINELGTEGAYSNNNFYYWNNGTNNNNWEESNLNKENLNSYYLNTYLGKKESIAGTLTANKWQQMIAYHTWITEGNILDKLQRPNAKEAFENEINMPNVGTELPTAAKKFDAYIGLFYITDYYYAATSHYWSYDGYNVGSAAPYDDYRNAILDNWFYINVVEGGITRNSDNSVYSTRINSNGTLSRTNVYSEKVNIRPSFYLNSNVKIIDGYGTSTDPYIISQ